MKRLLFSTLIILLLANISSAQDPLSVFDKDKRWFNGFTEAWFYFPGMTEGDVRESIEHWERIGEEWKQPTNRFAGIFMSGGETHGDYFRWAPNNGFVWLNVNKCMGGPMQILRGRVEVISDGIVLTPEKSLGSSEGHGNHSTGAKSITLVKVDWLGTSFLVRPDDLKDFAEYSAGLGEFNGYLTLYEGSPFLLKMGGRDENESRETGPVFPERYKQFAKFPVRGKVLQISKPRRVASDESDSVDDLVSSLVIELDGKTAAVKDLSLLAVGKDQSYAEKFVITGVRGNRATVRYRRWVTRKPCIVSANDDCKDPEHMTLRIGMVLSSNGL